MKKAGTLPSRDGTAVPDNVLFDDGKILVELGGARTAMNVADALALASKLICLCEVVERAR
jgi:hypothetical protein